MTESLPMDGDGMGPDGPPTTSSRPLMSRRSLMASAAAMGVGATAALAFDAVASKAEPAPTPAPSSWTTRAFYGAHQDGIEMAPQAHQNLVALDLLRSTTPDDLRRMLLILTKDGERMTAAKHALADSEPELAHVPSNLTVTVGFGPRVIEIVRGPDAVPRWLGPLPAFAIDRLEDQWNGGDLLLQIASDDPTTLSHATRMLLKDASSFATVRWAQPGFRNAAGSQPEGTTMRNLLGQVDGTVNPAKGSDDFAAVVWRNSGGDGTDWLANGTTMVIRRVEMDLAKWDRLDRGGREASIGRRLSDGAPLTGNQEHDEPDFDAKTPIGFPVIPEFCHMRRARGETSSERIFRRGYNYDLGPANGKTTDAGLVFTSFQRDVETQFVPIQERLAELDLLNVWTTPIGSAVFAIPGGTEPEGFIGERLF